MAQGIWLTANGIWANAPVQGAGHLGREMATGQADTRGFE